MKHHFMVMQMVIKMRQNTFGNSNSVNIITSCKSNSITLWKWFKRILILLTQCPQAARLPKGTRRRPVNACVILHCNLQHSLWSFCLCCHRCAETVDAKMPLLPSWRPASHAVTATGYSHTHKHTHTDTHSYRVLQQTQLTCCRYGSLILLSHCVLGQRWLFAALSPSLS